MTLSRHPQREVLSEPAPARSRWRLPALAPLLDRYFAREIMGMTMFCVLGFVILIVGYNFYANAEFVMGEHKIPFGILAQLSLMEAPASIVLAMPFATTFGVMLAVGRLGRDSEIIAMRAGGASLVRLVGPVLVVGVLLSALNYGLGEYWVPSVGKQAEDLRREFVGKEKDITVQRDVFFRDEEGRIIYAQVYHVKEKELERPFVYRWRNGDPRNPEDDEVEVWSTFSARFEGDTLVFDPSAPLQHRVFRINPVSETYDQWLHEELDTGEARRWPFAAPLQEVVEQEDNAQNSSAADLAETSRRMQSVGRNPVKTRTDLAVKVATPVACAIFAFVAFIFGMVNPRRERFTGAFYALVLIFWYYILNAIAKNLGYNEILRPPELAAWATNILFLIMAIVLFLRMR